MKTVFLSKEAVHNGSLILINADYPICAKHYEKRFVPFDEKKHSVTLEMRTAAILQNLLEDVDAGQEIVAVSGFRSQHEQTQIYNNSLLDNGAEFTAKYVALPNHSEHQSGLAVDLALNRPDIDAICPYFPYTGICKTFRRKAEKFGFVERYPKGKENVTGIGHEPWHFRYVGAPHAKIMQEMSFTLEEYLLWVQGFPKDGKHLRYSYDGADIGIFYFECSEIAPMFEIEENLPYSVSGDNKGGFIVTLWRERT